MHHFIQSAATRDYTVKPRNKVVWINCWAAVFQYFILDFWPWAFFVDLTSMEGGMNEIWWSFQGICFDHRPLHGVGIHIDCRNISKLTVHVLNLPYVPQTVTIVTKHTRNY